VLDAAGITTYAPGGRNVSQALQALRDGSLEKL
jgi:predicted Fe-Mo cluster-binding NifX family protein